jgi:hypothetical protein
MGDSQENQLAQQEKIRVDAIDRVARLTRELSADQAALAQSDPSFAEPANLLKRAIRAALQLEKALDAPNNRKN